MFHIEQPIYPIFDQIKNFMFKGIFCEQPKLWIFFQPQSRNGSGISEQHVRVVNRFGKKRWHVLTKPRKAQIQDISHFFFQKKINNFWIPWTTINNFSFLWTTKLLIFKKTKLLKTRKAFQSDQSMLSSGEDCFGRDLTSSSRLFWKSCCCFTKEFWNYIFSRWDRVAVNKTKKSTYSRWITIFF